MCVVGPINQANLGRIAIIEDEAIVALDLESQLVELGWDVVGLASNEADALSLVREHHPDLVLMDIRLGQKMIGPDIALTIRREWDIPCVFLTAYTDRETVEKCKASQPLGYLVKPLDERMFGLTLEMAFNHETTRIAKQQAQLARQRAESRYFAILQNSSDGVLTIDVDEKIVVFSRGAERCFQYSASEVLGRPLACLLPRSEVAAHSERIRNFFEPAREIEMVGVMRAISAERKNGERFPAEITTSRHFEGKHAFITAIVRDITSRRELEKQYSYSQRLEAVGRLGASVAHEFNNLLQAISAFQSLLPGSSPEEAEELMNDCTEVVDRGAALSRQLLDLSQRQVDEPVSMGLSDLVQRAVTMAKRLLGGQIRVEFERPCDAYIVRLPVGQFEQVMLNLMLNARDAMLEGGTLRFAVKRHQGLKDHALLTVSDTGTGIDEQTLGKVFEPFFTTKPEGMGTGLGLPTSKRLVDGWGGAISVDSQQGNGTVFGITIPCTNDGVVLSAEARIAVGLRLTGAESILLIEPDPNVREFLARVLARHGYSIVAVHALADVHPSATASQLVICSSTVAEGHTAELLSFMDKHKTKPGLLLLNGSGKLQNFPSEDVGVVNKPISSVELLVQVRRAMDRAGSAGR